MGLMGLSRITKRDGDGNGAKSHKSSLVSEGWNESSFRFDRCCGHSRMRQPVNNLSIGKIFPMGD